jgi:hypothetical protein
MSDFFSNIITIFIIFLFLLSLFGKKDDKKNKKESKKTIDINIDITTNNSSNSDLSIEAETTKSDIYHKEIKSFTPKKSSYKSQNIVNDIASYTNNNKNNVESTKKQTEPFFNISELKKAVIYSEILNKPKFKQFFK